ncbi:MAG: hypothetical protein LC102_09390 [Ignavibacteriales bacterium]|nr:MAG: hypothetical protein F9K26_03030 [Ignavibacteriaceae bacterium]MBW7872409.1 hypothetical protein [Ignavibacteria bacterium]MCZ2143628.1 hypothetical protein [Ignavibacteriales bacterium]MBV6445443.1 hypothetical protein [Ignavibacteriaceae bacterium]MBZ0196749.1 hypothetical protein [Ignavibacteriaceae bacterium]
MKKLLLLLPALLLFSGCGEKFDLSVFDSEKSSGNIAGDTVYVKLTPEWGGFNNPTDIIIGKDYFLYLADTDNNRIVMLNQNGDILSTRTISKPTKIEQDYQLNLLVVAKFDTTINNVTSSVDAVYKINMLAGGHNVANAPMARVLPRPGRGVSSSDLRVNYTGVCVFYDNSFLVARTGPNNTSVVDPDNSILQFEKTASGQDTLIGRLPAINPTGTGIMSANGLSSLTAFDKRNVDFIMTLRGDNSFRVQWLTWVVSSLGEQYELKLSPEGGSDLMAINGFKEPSDVTIDKSGNIYVADIAKDTVYRYNQFGGILQKIGGADNFIKPAGLAHYDKVLYVVDKANGKIVRFRLSTDT